MKLESLALHHGYQSEPTTKAAAVPIYQTTSYTFDNTQHGADLFDLKVEGASKTAAEPHLLLAVATDVPLDLPGSGTPAEPYFAQLLSMADARLQPLAVAVKYFKLGG